MRAEATLLRPSLSKDHLTVSAYPPQVSRYFWGVMPSIFLKVRCRTVRSVKPQCRAMASFDQSGWAAMVRLASSSTSAAFCSAACIHSGGGTGQVETETVHQKEQEEIDGEGNDEHPWAGAEDGYGHHQCHRHRDHLRRNRQGGRIEHQEQLTKCLTLCVVNQKWVREPSPDPCLVPRLR